VTGRHPAVRSTCYGSNLSSRSNSIAAAVLRPGATHPAGIGRLPGRARPGAPGHPRAPELIERYTSKRAVRKARLQYRIALSPAQASRRRLTPASRIPPGYMTTARRQGQPRGRPGRRRGSHQEHAEHPGRDLGQPAFLGRAVRYLTQEAGIRQAAGADTPRKARDVLGPPATVLAPNLREQTVSSSAPTSPDAPQNSACRIKSAAQSDAWRGL
jgi:hypothetical protein